MICGSGKLFVAGAFGLDYVGVMDYSHIISIDSDRRSGQPCIVGTRITVGDVLGYLASGMTHEEILHDFPELTEEYILASLAYAADCQRRTVRVNV